MEMHECDDSTMKGEMDRSTEEQDSNTEVRCGSLRPLKNVVLISVSFMLLFTSFSGLARLQSSLHLDEGMGVICSSVLYGSLVVSSLLLPTWVIRHLGHKRTMGLSMVGYILWMAANGYAVWGTMIPASILVGICAAPLWTAKCSYLTITANIHGEAQDEGAISTSTRYFGIFFFFFQLTNVIGSAISSGMLQSIPANISQDSIDSVIAEYCGRHDCPGNPLNQTELKPQDPKLVWSMLYVYIAIAVVALLVMAIGVDQLQQPTTAAEEDRGVLQNLIATVRHHRHTEHLLVIPLVLYGGFEQAFSTAELTKSFVSCPYGIWMIGFVIIPYGCADALMSLVGGHLVKRTGRLPIFTLAMVIDLSIQITLLLWTPKKADMYVAFILASLWGLSDGVWQTQINGMLSTLFPNESQPAFSAYKLWESIGYIIPFAYSNFLCTSTKLYILLTMLLCGMSCYYVLEIKLRSKLGRRVVRGTEYKAAGCQAEDREENDLCI